jgi:hypothetical protein
MMLFDAEGKIKRYESPEQILQEFFDLRLQFYEKRRVALLQVGSYYVSSGHRNGCAVQAGGASWQASRLGARVWSGVVVKISVQGSGCVASLSQQ